MSDYQAFLESKKLYAKPVGREIAPEQISPLLFPFQRDIAHWAIRKGRAAIFADTGLGKTRMQLEFTRLISSQKALIIAPLSVARQTQAEADQLGYHIEYVRGQEQTHQGYPIYITNYEMAHEFDPDDFDTVVLDESSILKNLDSKTRLQLTAQFKHTPYRLACTATPAPNDLKELVNHADFLGVMSRKEVFATFFMNEEKNGGLHTRLKHHAVDPFYRWLASWAMAIKKPSDLGYDDTGYDLPPLTVTPHVIPVDYRPDGMLFLVGLKGVTDRAKVQRATLDQRVAKTVELVNGDQDQWIIWHHLNDEGKALVRAIPGAVLVEGPMSAEAKADAYERFQDGEYRVLVTKPSIAGMGMNFQNAHKMCFAGINDSFEEFYQAIRREYRYKQTHPVEVHVIYADAQQDVYENILRKQHEANELTDNLIREMRAYEHDELANTQRGENYRTDERRGNGWTMMLGDLVERLTEIETNSVGIGVHSPPFIARYTYTATERDLGNSKSPAEFMKHYQLIIRELFRVTMPGRNQCVHVQQVRTTKRDTGNVGLRDFRGMVIRAFQREGFVYSAEFTIDKDAQQQARRKHHIALKFQTLHSDSSKLGSALADYLLVFKKPGDNPVKVVSDVSEAEWILWARPVWYDIDEIAVLDSQKTKMNDEPHLCPLQLPLIERCYRLWSNPGETALSPFAGIGSEGYEAVRLGRKFIGIELKPEYYQIACANLMQAEQSAERVDLWTWAAQSEHEQSIEQLSAGD